MSADQEHFRSQIEDCKNTWLSVLKDEKYINIINKYINKIDWLYYDSNIKNKYNIVTNKDNWTDLEMRLKSSMSRLIVLIGSLFRIYLSRINKIIGS